MQISHLDHLVLTVRDIQQSIDFYTQVLGMQLVEFANNRKALKFSNQKINLHQAGNELKPHADNPAAGSADLCFIVKTPVIEIINELKQHHIPIETGPVERNGATKPLISIYIRDPDNNLIELSNAVDG